MHISEVEDKTAAALAEADLVDDFYHQNIQAAAKKLVKQGQSGVTFDFQLPSGATVWSIEGVHILMRDEEQILVTMISV